MNQYDPENQPAFLTACMAMPEENFDEVCPTCFFRVDCEAYFKPLAETLEAELGGDYGSIQDN